MIKLHYGGRDLFFQENEILIPGLHYERMCQIPSDINEHLPVIKRYAEDCDSITEMGVRFACSTWAFIEARPKKLTCMDIMYEYFEPSEKYINMMFDSYGIDFKWITGDSLKTEIENTDLLFIDTLHTYSQLLGELRMHSDKVSKYIILHDTTTFGHRNEGLYDHASDIVKNSNEAKEGLVLAVEDFISENNSWKIREYYTNNNGLTILERI